MTPQEIIEEYTGRWNIETTFEEARAYLGLETTRGWCAKTVLRAEPCLLGLYSVVALLYWQLPAEEQEQGAVEWEGKRRVTFSDAITAVRRWLWTDWVFPRAGHGDAFEKLPAAVPADAALRSGPRCLSAVRKLRLYRSLQKSSSEPLAHHPILGTNGERPRREKSLRRSCDDVQSGDRTGVTGGGTMKPSHRPINRRQLLQIGGVGALGLGLPRLLRAAAPRSSDKSCIFIVQYGGASHIDGFDPKPDAPEGVRGPYQTHRHERPRRPRRRAAAAPRAVGRPLLPRSVDEPRQRRT